MISRLRHERVIRGLSLDQIFVALGIDITKLSRAERGFITLRDSEIAQLAEFYKVPAKELFPPISTKRRPEPEIEMKG